MNFCTSFLNFGLGISDYELMSAKIIYLSNQYQKSLRATNHILKVLDFVNKYFHLKT